MKLSINRTDQPVEPYIVASLADCDPAYGELIARRGHLREEMRITATAVRQAEKDLANDESVELRPGVAALLGDDTSPAAALRTTLREAKARRADLDAAVSILERRIADARTPANRAACAAVKPEFDRRMGALCDALKAADAAHQTLDELCMALEAEDIQYGSLGPRPFFLGGAREPDRQIVRFLKEVGNA